MAERKNSPTQPSTEFRQILFHVNLAGRKPLPQPDGFIHGSYLFDDLFVPEDEHDELQRWLSESQTEKEWLTEMRQFLEESLENRSIDFRRFIWGNVAPTTYIEEEPDDPTYDLAFVWKGTVRAAMRYQQTRSWQMQMDYLVDLTERIVLAMGKNRKPESPAQRAHSVEKLSQLPEALVCDVTEEGVFTARPAGILEAINGKELARIRRCKKCEKIFWAKRWDSKCCSLECNNSYNVLESTKRRKGDADHTWKQEIKRRATQRAKKALRQLKYTDADIKAYQKRYRKYPHRVIYGHIIQACLDNQRLTPERVSIKKVIQPLRDFLAERSVV